MKNCIECFLFLRRFPKHLATFQKVPAIYKFLALTFVEVKLRYKKLKATFAEVALKDKL